MASVKLTNVKKIYDTKVVAVHDFNLDIADKEFIVFVGPSGCGKSTTLRMIAGLEDISDGTVEIDGVVVNDLQPRDRDIAMVFQNYALYPHLTVFENMAFSLRLKKVPNDEVYERVTGAAEVLGITEYLARKPRALSGCQRQRVAIGRAMVRDSKVFLMDEPLSNLDAKLRNQMRAEIILLRQKIDTTFIYVTHDQTEAMTMGTRIVVMKDGFIQQVAAPTTLYEYPCNLFVATFIGSPQMNIFDATIIDKDGSTYIEFGNARIKLPDAKGRNPEVLAYAGKEVAVGIRPENIHDEDSFINEHQEAIVEADVDVVERLGSVTYLYVQCEGNSLIASVKPTSTVKTGDHVKLAFDVSRIHLFDKDTEKVIAGEQAR